MAFPGETIHLGAYPYCECGKLLEERVMRSNAGYYIGTQCCQGPHSRESHYYPSWAAAEEALKTNTVNYREL